VDRPRIDELLDKAGGSRYALAIIAAKRARQINNYYNSLGEGLLLDDRSPAEDLTPPLITTRSKNLLTIALQEIAEKRIGFTYRDS
jgi:DNA-directed RNA polymerase subunit omega